MKYVMVTHWDDHWDGIGGEATYSFNMLRGHMTRDRLKEHTPTIFIKLNKNNRVPERAWKGETHSFNLTNRIGFKFDLIEEVEVPPEYANLKEGWHVFEDGAPVISDFESKLSPPFFKKMLDSGWQDPYEFEEDCFLLLKLLGIHEIHRFTEQKGQSDGFFKIRSLAVVYDATLERDFEKVKKDQINNYCGQLRRGVLEYEGGVDEVPRDFDKQVWLTTKGRPQVIKRIDDITVKEVPVSSIIKVYLERIQNALTEVDLAKRLADM